MGSVKDVDHGEFKSSGPTTKTKNDVVTLAESAVHRDGQLATQSIACSYHEGVLMLRGCVRTDYLKQVAQSVVMVIDGIEQVDNRIEVRERKSTLTGNRLATINETSSRGFSSRADPDKGNRSCEEAKRC